MCHAGEGAVARTGSGHQAAYDQLYQDGVIKVSSMAFAASGTTATLTFKMTKSGAPFDCTKSTASTSDFTIGSYWTAYTSATRTFSPGRVSLTGSKAYDATSGTCTLKATGLDAATVSAMNGNGIATVYGTDGIVYRNSATHITTGKYPFGGVLKVGTVDYTSAANVSGCENCHTQPFLKHTYIYGQVDDGTGKKGLDFYMCKGCHVDTNAGGDFAWQIKKDGEVNNDLTRWADIAVNGSAYTDAEKAKYAYKTRLMNDVHMSHAMEFAYPQSMKNCVTCHAGKLDVALADDKFKAETCRSCHSVDGLKKIMSSAAFPHTAFIDNPDATNCTNCHSAAAGAVGPTFKTIHNGGYDPMIYTGAGVKYANVFTATIDSVTIANNKLDIKFSAKASQDIPGLSVASISPTVLVGLYGYDSKDFIVAAHGRDAQNNRLLEYVVGATHPRFTTVSAANGSWEVTADLSMWADQIAAGTIKRAEIAVLPALKDANGVTLGLNAPSRTFDLTKNAFDDTFFKDIVKVKVGANDPKACNSCHDQLATTFHSGDRGGNIKVCRICHEVSNPAAHLELQSRSIDSYVHAIHAFQILDRQNYDLTQLVDKAEYEEHIGQQFPRFGTDCESCHVAGMFDVPNQAKSMPGVLAATNTVKDVRAIGGMAPAVSGPAVRACGACHRSELIKEDDAAGLTVLTQHFRTFGYVIDTTTADFAALWQSVVAKIMALFS